MAISRRWRTQWRERSSKPPEITWRGPALRGRSKGSTIKVYISSTYQDLVDYRAAVDRTLRRMGHDVIGMEQYVAEGSKPVERCKADVRAADAYVIIVAWRFGYAPGRMASPP